MAISSAVVKFKRGAENSVRQELSEVAGVEVEMTTPQGDFIIIVEAKKIDALHETYLKIEKLKGVIGVYPSYVTTEDEE